MNPFIYPKALHRRTLNVPGLSHYSLYKPILRQEFRYQCIYCRLPDGVKGQDNFGVDHYRPRKLFPELSTTITNLFYACNACNRRKRDFWPGTSDLEARRFIPNPCDHVMFEHLRYRSTLVDAHSPAGEHTKNMLMLNDEESVQYRDFVLGTIALAEEKKRLLSDTLSRIEKMLPSAPQPEELKRDCQACVDQLEKIEKYLARLTGGSA